MKICPNCKQTYEDNSLNFCLNDGSTLIQTENFKSAETVSLNQPNSSIPTEQYVITSANAGGDTVSLPQRKSNNLLWVLAILGGLILVCGGGLVGLLAYLSQSKNYSSNSGSVNSNSINIAGNTNRTSNIDTNAPNINTAPDVNINSVNTANETNSSVTESTALTMEKYLKLKSGMSYKEAVKILGGEGTETSDSNYGDKNKTVSYKWENGDKEHVSLIFQNDKLNSKSQSGLNPKINSTLTLAKYNQLKNDMSYRDAAEILGEGDEQSSSNLGSSEFISYQWKGNNFSYIIANFQNGKLTSKSQFALK